MLSKKMFTCLVQLPLMLLLAINLHAQTKWTTDTATVTFSIKNAGITVNGNFGGFQGDLLFDANALPSSHLNATIDVTTINTGIDARDNHLKKEAYFDAAAYPKIALNSVKLYKSGAAFAGLFTLKIKNKTSQVEIPFSAVQTGNSIVFTGSFTINRRDFDVGGNSLILSDNVTIGIVVNAKK